MCFANRIAKVKIRIYKFLVVNRHRHTNKKQTNQGFQTDDSFACTLLGSEWNHQMKNLTEFKGLQTHSVIS